MTGPPAFRLTRNGAPLASLSLGETEVVGAEAEAPALNEGQHCGFQVDGREPDTEYRLWIGDRDPEPAPGAAVRAVGLPRGTSVFWDDAAHFEGARGRVWVSLASRPADSAEPWRQRARLPVSVLATKLSDARYNVMVAQLRALAAGLIFDLSSKMLRSLQLGGAGGVSARSSQVELRLLEQLWSNLARPLQEIAANPVTQLSLVREVRPSWGGERLRPGTVARLAGQGVDPRRPGTPRPFHALAERFTESTRTTEHRIILGLLRFLDQRVVGCARNVRQHIRGIEADRPLRERPPPGGQSLYETEDVPRLQGLRAALARARRLRQRIRLAERIGPLRGVQPLFRIPSTPVFEHVRPYRTLRQEFGRYLHSSLIVLDDGLEERLKSTSRMYERWVFFQLAAAFRAAGLRCVTREGVFRRSQRFRFTLDVDRGARLTFLDADGRAVSLRFEPWVLPHAAARQRNDTVYRGTRGEAAWSPDVLIEFLAGPEVEGPEAEVKYAVLVDAKYTARVQEHHWDDTAKYLEIRAVRNRRQVVKQLWLACPSDEAGIALRDSALTWGPQGPDCPRDEVVQGVLGLIPPERLPADADAEEGWISTPVATARAFVDGLLAYLDVPRPPRDGTGAPSR